MALVHMLYDLSHPLLRDSEGHSRGGGRRKKQKAPTKWQLEESLIKGLFVKI